MKAEEFASLRERLARLLRTRGYWNPRRRTPDIARFCRQYSGYRPGRVASWLNPRERRRPNLRDLQRLAMDLQESYTYLLLGRAVFDEPEWGRLQAAYQREAPAAVPPIYLSPSHEKSVNGA